MGKRTSLRSETAEDANLKKWYIAYTLPKAEKRIHAKLQAMGFTSFLPLQKIIRNWSDRKKKLEVPLFPNYIFIYASASQRFEAMIIKEILRYISFDGKPATVSDTVIESLRKMLAGEVEVTNEKIVKGTYIKIVEGLFTGAEGILIQKNGANRLVVQIEALQSAISIDISASKVVPLNRKAVSA